MLKFYIKRVLELPQILKPSTFYIVKKDNSDFVDLFFTNEDGSAVKRALTEADVKSLIEQNSINNVNWADILNGPMSDVTDIDQAVLDAHTHSNKSNLDLISSDSDKNLMFNNSYPATPLTICEW